MRERSWNRTLAHQRAVYMGQEFHRKGVNLLLGPVVGPLGRVAEGGRNWEGFSNDPYLTGALVYETVQGVQSSGVGVSTKVGASYYFETAHHDSSQIALHWQRARDKPEPRNC